MSHTYVDVKTFKDYLADSGGSQYGTATDAAMLVTLEGASRRVDGFCGRSSFESGFGPRIASNVYNHDGSNYLDLSDDFIAVTSVTAATSTGQSQVAMTVNSDYFLDPSHAPYRGLQFAYLGGVAVGYGLNVFTVAGTAGYSSETVSLGTSGTATSTATTLTMTAGSAFAGMTLLIDSEQIYVTDSGGTAGTSLTVVRGVNGTTAAVHAASATVSRYRYDRAVESGTLLVAQRRWRMRDAGVTGNFGAGMGIPGVPAYDSERSVLNAAVGHLRVFGAV